MQNALICIYYARFPVPVPGSGSCIAVSLYRFLVVAEKHAGNCNFNMAEGEGNLSQQRAVSLLQEETRLIREYPGSSNDVSSAQVASPNVISQSESHATTSSGSTAVNRAFFKNSSVGGPSTKRDHTIPSVEK